MIRRAMVWSIGLVFACGGGSSTATDGGQATDADGLATDAQSTDTALAREITSLAFLAASNSALTADVTTTIAGTMITAEVPFGTSLSGLVATFTTSGGTVSVAGTPQVSGVTANDFTGPLVYRMSASDGSYRDYTVVVTAPRAQRMYLQASNAEAIDLFGASVALSADGTTLAVGAYGEDSAATGIGGNQASNAASYAGAVYVFVRSGAAWSQQAYVKASNTDANDSFGARVTLSADGNTLAVAGRGEASASTNQGDNSAVNAGAVYVFARSGTTWSQQAYLKASNVGVDDWFGASLDLADDGNTLAVGANYEASAATGINGDQLDNTMPLAGAVYVFARSGTAWSQQAYVKASNTSYAGRFGDSVALDGTGNTLAVGSGGEANYTGATFIFTRAGTTWTQQAHLHASNPDAGDGFGTAVALSSDGGTLAVTGWSESSAATGINGDQTNNASFRSGAVYVFTVSGTTWAQQAYLKASNTSSVAVFGSDLALSQNGNTLAVGSAWEDSIATDSGAIYMFARSGTTWTQQQLVKVLNPAENDQASGVGLTADGTVLVIGAYGQGGSSGAAYVFE